jgi:hypothetical protein
MQKIAEISGPIIGAISVLKYRAQIHEFFFKKKY